MHKYWPQPSGRPPQKKQIQFLLDQFSSADIKKWNNIKDLFLKFHWDFYSSLAFQRSKFADEIKKSLLEASHKSYTFTRWQRVVRFKHSVEPLSLTGSLADPGGRFNIGGFKTICGTEERDSPLTRDRAKLQNGQSPKVLLEKEIILT